MNLPQILEKLLPWVVEHGFSNHSLAELAKPLGLTRGAFCYYFSNDRGSIKDDIGRQLIFYARQIRQRFLGNPVAGYGGPLVERRAFFAEQMFHYLESSYRSSEKKDWVCPAFLLSKELRVLGVEEDRIYHDLLENLFRGPSEYLIMDLQGSHLEALVSGPYSKDKEAVLRFFKVPGFCSTN